MQWWNDVTTWFSSDEGRALLTSVVVPFVAVLVAGLLAALVARSAVRRVLARQERDARGAAVAGLVRAARKAAVWSSLGTEERTYVDHLAQEAEVQVRLLGAPGANSAASWAEHELAGLKRHSVSFSFQAEQSLAEFRDRLLQWHARPGRAKKLFADDLDRWGREAAGEREAQQRATAEPDGHASERPEAPVRPEAPLTPATSPLARSVQPEPLERPQRTWDVPTQAIDVAADRDDDVDASRHEAPVSATTVRRRTAPEPDDR